MKRMFRVTYEVITEESAEHGDAAERGFITANGMNYADDEDGFDDFDFNLSLREALNKVGSLEDSGHWFSEVDEDWSRPGERRSLHPPSNITPSSYDRLVRVLKGERYL